MTEMLMYSSHGAPPESPLPLWERDRVRGLAPVGANESVARGRAGIEHCNDSFARCRAQPLTLSLSHKGRGDSVGLPVSEHRR
jgi:hypothetical protein